MDTSIIKKIIDKLLPKEVNVDYDDPLWIELLQITTLLLTHLPNYLVHHCKELIKFDWNCLKKEESASK
jgi:hypothetical protein